MKDIKEFIRRREREIHELIGPKQAQIDELKAEIAALSAELTELDRAARAIGMVNGLQKIEITRRQPRGPTIKEAVLAVLQDRRAGLTALEILSEINDRFRLNLARTSLSPQLTRLKREHKIRSEGVLWKPVSLTQKGSEQ